MNDLRKDVAYGEPGDELADADLEGIVGELETLEEEVVEEEGAAQSRATSTSFHQHGEDRFSPSDLGVSHQIRY